MERCHGRSPTGCASASATTSARPSTCRRWCSATATTTRAPASGFTRNAATGENKPYGDFLINAQGEDVVAGIRNTEDLDALAAHFPAIHDELLAIFDRLERHYRDMCDTEFTIEQGKLWMLQTRVGKRTGARRAADGRRHDEGHRHAARRSGRSAKRGGADAGHRRAPRLGAAPAVRRARQGARQGPRRVARRRRRQGVLHRRRRRSTPPTAARRSSSCATRRAPRTSTG